MLSHIDFPIFLTRVLKGATDVPPLGWRSLTIGREDPRAFWQTESFGAPNLRELRIAARIIVYLLIIGYRQESKSSLELCLRANRSGVINSAGAASSQLISARQRRPARVCELLGLALVARQDSFSVVEPYPCR
jgi:hypothetical protein